MTIGYCEVRTTDEKPNAGIIRKGSQALTARLATILALLFVLSPVISGCRDANALWDLIYPMSHSERSDPATTAAESHASDFGPTEESSSVNTITATSADLETGPTSKQQDLVLPDEHLSIMVSRLILAALNARTERIELDDVFQIYHVDESQVQSVIDAVFAIYQEVYNEHPEFFYLNGSFEVSYTLLKGRDTVISAMYLVPGFTPDAAGLTAKQLDDLILRVMHEVTQIADEIKMQSEQPVERAILLHDLLIRRIAYDEHADLDKNTVQSALLAHTTLCQGYARSFQLISQKLGLKVSLISGQSGGIGHAWNLIDLDGKTYHIDVTHDDPLPDQGAGGPIDHRHLFRSDDQMAPTHQWERKSYPACPDDGAFYYVMNNLTVSSQDELKTRIDTFLAGIDYALEKQNRLELLYTGEDLLSAASFQSYFKSVLQDSAAGFSVTYRADSDKSVLVMEVQPQP